MQEALDRLEQATEAIAKRDRYNSRNRRALLVIHGVMGVSVGILLFTGGSAQSMIDVFGEGSPVLWLLNLSSLCGGLVLLAGVFIRQRRPGILDRLSTLLEAVGMTVMLLWDAGMAVTLGVAAHKAATDGDPLTHTAAYPVAVYTGLAALMAVHLLTLLELISDSRSQRARRG